MTERTRFRVPSHPDAVGPAVDYLVGQAVESGAVSERQTTRLLLALHEALNNAVVHGNLEVPSDLKERADDAFIRTVADRAADPRYASRSVEVETDFDGRRCQWAVTDQGRGFDVEAVLQHDLTDPERLLLASGRGIQIMRTFMDEVRYEDGGRRVVLVLNRPAAPAFASAPPVPVVALAA
jgi:anti-sigma regulatory factor (Ser/Thr protein kinase)